MKKIVLCLISTILLLTACGGAGSTSSVEGEANTSFYAKDNVGFETSDQVDTADYYAEDSYEDASYENEATEAPSEGQVDLEEYDSSRKLVYSSYISLESKKFEQDVSAVKKLVTESGGYFESTSTSGSKEDGNRSASFAARVPADKYESFMGSVGDVGSLTYKSESVDDITSSYVDVQARLKSLNTKLERLQELEANAENITELLEIEDRINEVQYEIESYTAQKKVYDDQVDYSTINIDITAVVTYSEVKADTAWNRFVKAFGDSFSGFILFLQGVVIAIIYLLPYIIIIAIVLFIIFRVRKKKGKSTWFKKKDKKEKENSEV